MPEQATLPTPPAATPAPAPSAPKTPELPLSPESTTDPFDAMDKAWQERTKPKGQTDPTSSDSAQDAEAGSKDGKEPTRSDSESAETNTGTSDAGNRTAAKPKEERTIAPKQLRENLERANAELKQHKEKVAALEAKMAEAEKRGKDTTALAERLAAAEKERDDARASLRAAKQEMDPEFVEKYEKPFEREAEYVKREVEQLMVLDEEGTPTRQATWEDFTQFYSMPRGKAIAQIKQMFGDASGIVLSHLSSLQKLDFAKQSALREEKAKWAERTKAEEAQRVQQREAFDAASSRLDKELRDKHPEWYAEDPSDTEGNELLKQGYELVDTKPRTFQEAVILRANIRNRAAAFSRMALRFTKLQQENADLKAKLEGKKDAHPGPTKRPAGTEPKPEKSMMDDLRESLA